jgi:hypothetical protein
MVIDRDLMRNRKKNYYDRVIINIIPDRDIMELKKYRDLIEPKRLKIEYIAKRKLVL